MGEQDQPKRGLYGQRPSKSADESRRAQFERLRKMTPRERMILALQLGQRSRLFRAKYTPQEPDGDR